LKPASSKALSQATAPVEGPSPGQDHGWQWMAVLWIGAVHVGALAAPFVFTWKGLAIAAVLAWMTASLGICLGFHRLLTHSGFETYRPVRWFFVLLGTLAGEGPPIMWVAAHRRHHQFSDLKGDPHSPKDGFYWGHVFWMLRKRGSAYWAKEYRRYAPDLMRDSGVRFLNHTWLWWQPLTGGILFAVGALGWDTATGLSFLVYGLFVRLVFVFHGTWFVNSATHTWGYRNYETTDDSRNLWWVGLWAFGEGWHNNHHAHPRMARHGHKWWELDLTYWAIRSLECTGLAWNVLKTPTVERPETTKVAADTQPRVDDPLESDRLSA
jgi:stearoyl-CoA desaturase (delta-9 desaturase)